MVMWKASCNSFRVADYELSSLCYFDQHGLQCTESIIMLLSRKVFCQQFCSLTAILAPVHACYAMLAVVCLPS